MPSKNRAIEPPNLPSFEILDRGIPNNQLDELESYKNLHLSNCQLEGSRGVDFKYAYFDNVKTINTYFNKLSLQDVRITKSDFANTEWEEGSLNRVEFFDCRLLGFKIIKSRLRNVIFKGCQGQFAQFNFSKFERVIFENCILENSTFLEASLTNVKFINCQMNNIILADAKFKDTDFRGSNLEGLQIHINQLQGVTLDPFQAAYILQRYANVIVKPVDEEIGDNF
ncbi:MULTISPECIES: pentapeptide repeat-containing protein [Nostoc]|uniref:Pentapeptide repeat-containing protein n=1 Tax=Nostoc paludosum FACHB-159 TaxID=2692908 RepID=A0ABR8K5E1_9NOSO|nr:MULTISPECIES: pentapeptide repeat-containing protein [Nostoc]MBD2677850.1 pentapeptide repeat-containing protein [Nostoc sp. FACHB-857]MBD2733974.1 pentapeptide repeat-containing protein [Nostoc paludosum FACHB-159]